MHPHTLQRLWRAALIRLCVGTACLGAGPLRAAEASPAAPRPPSVKSSAAIAAELARETNLQAQLDRTLAPMNTALKQTLSGAHRIKGHFAAGTPEYQQAQALYGRVGQALAKVEGELAAAVRTIQPEDRGERAGRANKQVTAELNEALQAFNEFTNRLVPAPAAPGPKGLPTPVAPAGSPAGQPTPSGLLMQAVQPEQYEQAQQPGVSADLVVQVCNLFVVHTVGLSPKSVEAIRQQMLAQIRRQASLPGFEGA